MDGYWRIGAAASWRTLIDADVPPAFDGLKAAAREVGSVQIQNRATIVGNLCNASPAADGVPPLLTLDAEVEIAGAAGLRYLPLSAFILGNRKTALADGEMVSALRIPAASTAGQSSFLKLGARSYLVISISMAALRLEVDEAGIIRDMSLSIGACSEVAKRMDQLEDALRNTALATASARDYA
jgi:CO/xanthine dehydrogenase FAD-binding subunit